MSEKDRTDDFLNRLEPSNARIRAIAVTRTAAVAAPLNPIDQRRTHAPRRSAPVGSDPMRTAWVRRGV
jgi:hypothetical protein